MIKITTTKDDISIAGHANYAPYGQDIVCSAVSTLVQTFIESVEQLTNDKIKTTVESGEVHILFGESLSTETELLICSFLLGLELIAEAYPEYVSLYSND